MKNKLKNKAEDILINENLSREIPPITPDHEDGIEERQIQIAHRIYTFLRSSQTTFSDSDKEQTKNQIKSSIRRLNWNKQIKIWSWSAAAAILVLLCFTGVRYFQMNSTSEIVSFAQSLDQVNPDSDTRLILQDGKEIRIDSSESNINYAQNGENISIGTNRKVVQKIELQKPAFNTVIVPYGKRTLITLSEGSKVWLNSGSKLIYSAVFAEDKREVFIEGEAVFEVTHSETKPFQVHTRDFDIKVLGTVFSVSAYSDDKNPSAILAQGKVELSCKGNILSGRESFSISPGTMAVFNPEQKSFKEKHVNPQSYMSWREGYLNFDHEKLANIVKKLWRYYNVEVILKDSQLGNETFSGNLDLKNTPEEVLNVIAQTAPFTFKYENNKILVIPK